jgi:hypothetical protein
MVSALLAILGSLIVFLFGVILWNIRDVKSKVEAVKDCLDGKVSKDDYRRDKQILWNRLDYHKHNGDGSVVIPQVIKQAGER